MDYKLSEVRRNQQTLLNAFVKMYNMRRVEASTAAQP
jgi:hypothetical protein